MFFSICIPQYGRYEHLKQQLLRLQEQSCQDFEVCISDDISPERRWDEMRVWLKASGLRHVYDVQERNLRYDANLRAAISLASGKYVLLMGNDDRLANQNTLSSLKAQLEGAAFPEVVLTNYVELGTGRVFRRVVQDGQVVSGLDAAMAGFRNYSFVSGLLFLREQAQALACERWDGSEMYQMALASRIVAAGGRLLGVAEVCVEKDIQLPGERVDSYANTNRHFGAWRDWWSGAKQLPLARFSSTAWDAVNPHCPPQRKHHVAFKILKQTLTSPYPYWIFEYKRVSGLHRAIGLAIAMRPCRVLPGFPANFWLRLRVRLLHAAVTFAALLTPVWLFTALEPRLHARGKRATWRQQGS